MKRNSITQVRAISGNTPEETALLFNEVMMELADLRPTYERDGNLFWVFFKVDVTETETLAEDYEVRGEGAYCKDCPHCHRDVNRFGEYDGRKKKATCTLKGERCWIDSRACDEFYLEKERKEGELSEGK